MHFTTMLQKRKIIILGILVLGIFIIGLVWQFGIKEKEGEFISGPSDKDAVLFEGKPSAVFEIGQTGRLGFLEITLFDFKESSYASSELDENYRRITKNYIAAQIKVFNSSQNQTENILIGLMDDRGNKYKPNYSVARNVPELKDFGRNMSIFSRIIQEGYIFFTDIDESAKTLQLIFALESTGEKIVFKINE